MRLVHCYEPENKAQESSVGRAWVPEAKEVQDATICWQGDGHSILGCKRRYYVGLFTQEKYNNWSVLYPAYSPDLAPSDFFLFPNLKKDIRGLHFRSDDGVMTAVEEWVNGKDPDFFISELMALEHHWSKCIHTRGQLHRKRRGGSQPEIS